MPSPFPGMDPYLEQSDVWEDFHTRLIARIADSLAAQVGANYVVKVEVRLFLHERSAKERSYFATADIGVRDPGTTGKSASSSTIQSPMQLKMPAVEIRKSRSIEIRDRKNRRVITVIELLSPSNKKSGPDRDDYLAKRREIIASLETNLVEIDLRRGGKRLSPPVLPACDYYALVVDKPRQYDLHFWPIGLRDRLPIVPIPLLDPDPPVKLNLKAIIDATYDAAKFGNYIYEGTPEPRLRPEDKAWAQKLLARSAAN